MLRFFGQFFVKSEAKLDVLRMHIQPRERLQLYLGVGGRSLDIHSSAAK